MNLIKLCDKVEKRKKDMDNLANSKRRDIDATLHLIKNTPSTPQENAPYIPPEVKQRLRAKLQKARDKVDLWDRAGRIHFGSYDDYRQAMDKDTARLNSIYRAVKKELHKCGLTDDYSLTQIAYYNNLDYLNNGERKILNRDISITQIKELYNNICERKRQAERTDEPTTSTEIAPVVVDTTTPTPSVGSAGWQDSNTKQNMYDEKKVQRLREKYREPGLMKQASFNMLDVEGNMMANLKN